LMFSVVLPAMVGVAIVASFVEGKLIANRMVYVNKRPKRVVQLGIGVWAMIIRILAVIGVITNSAIACFVYNDTALDEHPPAQRLLEFIILQNLFIALRILFELFINPVPKAITRCREINAIVLDELSGNVEGRIPPKPKAIPTIEIILDGEDDESHSDSSGSSL